MKAIAQMSAAGCSRCSVDYAAQARRLGVRTNRPYAGKAGPPIRAVSERGIE